MRTSCIAVAVTLVLGSTLAFGHCQIPCGIYGDDTRFSLLHEHVTTLEKSVAEINKESAAEKTNHNQLVRWVMNKEKHADEIKTIVLEYFLAQRVKPAQNGYEDMLKSLHGIIVSAMKVKQTADPDVVRTLGRQVEAFQKLYKAK